MTQLAERAGLLERNTELARLDAVIADACDGRGRLAIVEGPAGIGKSRLLEEAKQRAAAAGLLVLSARASELDRDFPFGIVRQLFERRVAGAEPARRATLLQGAAAPAAPLIGAGPPASPGRVGPGSAHARYHALYWLTANLADESPVALVLDDAHWADASSLRFLQFALPRLEGLPVAVLLATRAAEPVPDRQPLDALADDRLAVVVRPAPLSDRAVAALVAAELGGEPDARFADACHEATGGNPFLLRELLRDLASDGVAPAAALAARVHEVAPATVGRAVLLRLARLGEEATALARAVAVLGDGAPLRSAGALAGLSAERAGELAARLCEADILSPGRPAAFAHPIVRAAVHAGMGATDRARAHRRAAALLAEEGAPADAIAVHLLAAEPAEDADVSATLREAAAHALARGAPSTAAAFLRRALEEPPPGAERAGLTVELAAAELRAGEPAAAVAHFDEAARLTRDPRTRATWAWEHAVALQSVGRHDDAYALRERAVEEVAPVDRELALAIEVSLIASAGLDLSRLAWARERLERHGSLSPKTAGEWRLLATRAYHRALYGDEPARAVADAAERALASGGLLDGGFATTSFFAAIEVLWMADRAEPARRALDAAVEDARRGGSALGFACLSGWRGMLLARDGALIEAEADARACAGLSLEQGWFAMAPPMLGYVLAVLVDRGELDDAERLLEATGVAARPVDHDLTYYPMVHARARLRAARGDAAGGRADLAGLARRRARWTTEMTLVPAALAAPELASGDAGEARAHAERMLREAQTWGTARAIGMALRAAGLVEDGARGLEFLEEAVTVLESSPARLERARALADWGAALRRANRRAAARVPLRRALDIADACGARPLADRVRHELRAAGGRPRRPRVSGAEALTASERRIAAMAAEGLSNPEIAQALFVTKKTVEAHLSNAYRKLDIRSRMQLQAALRDARTPPV